MNNRRATTGVHGVGGTVVGDATGRGKGGDLVEYGVQQDWRRREQPLRREPGQAVAVLVAALFVMAAVLDVGPGLLDNVVQFGFGVAGVLMSRSPRGARAFLIAGGVVYLLLWQFGTVIDPSLVPFHTGNVGVHLLLVASMIGLAVLSGSRVPVPEAVVPETAFRDASTGYVRRRRVSSRPPGRDDRNPAPRTSAYRRLRTLTHRSRVRL